MDSAVSTMDGPGENRSRADQTRKAVEQVPAAQPGLVDWKDIWKPLTTVTGLFLLIFFLPMESSRFTNAVTESLALAKWYAQEHVLLSPEPSSQYAPALCFLYLPAFGNAEPGLARQSPFYTLARLSTYSPSC